MPGGLRSCLTRGERAGERVRPCAQPSVPGDGTEPRSWLSRATRPPRPPRATNVQYVRPCAGLASAAAQLRACGKSCSSDGRCSPTEQVEQPLLSYFPLHLLYL